MFFASVVTITVITAGILYWTSRNAPTAVAGWWNDAWRYRKAITINHEKVAGDLVNFPMLVSFTDTSLGTHAQADGDDIVFIAMNGEKLKYEIENFTPAAGVLVAWVKMPSISSTDDAQIFMYYGNAGAANQEDAENVWDENYVMVQHMEEDGLGTRYDSAKQNNDCRTYGYEGDEATTTAKINGGDDFDGSNDLIYASSSDSINFTTNDFTVSAWVKSQNVTDFVPIAEKANDNYWIDSYGWSFYIRDEGSGGKLTFQVKDQNGNSNHISGADTIDDDQWHYVVGVKTTDGLTQYVNGDYDADDNTYSYNASISTSSPLVIGAGNGMFEGIIDEVRLSNSVRSAVWIETEYNNQNDPATFLTAQAEETGPGPSGYWRFDEGYGTTAHDGSGQGNNGTVTGAQWQDESMCVSGKCLQFDGSGDNVIVPDF